MPAVDSARRRKLKRLRQNDRYDTDHRLLRKTLDPMVQAGLASCVRCGEPIEPGPWDLGHDDLTLQHSGPEHVACNRGAPNRNVTSQEW